MPATDRVLHLISSTDRRGAQVFASQLSDALGGEPEHHLVAVEPGVGSARLDVEVLGSSRADPRGVWRLARMLRSARACVAHGSSALLHGAVAAASSQRPFLYRNIGDPAAWGRVRAADLRIGLPLRRAAGVAAIYPGARDHLVTTYRLDPDRVHVIPTGVPTFPLPTPADRASAAASLELDRARRWVGFVGALSAEKEPLAAVDAVAADDALGLVVAGGGPLAEQVRAAADRLGPDRVRLLGVRDDPLTVLSAVDVLVMPSRTEGIPAVAIEAGLCGVPVVATAVGGVPEVVEDATTGVLVASTDPDVVVAALHRALDEATAMGANARARCEDRFGMDRIAAAWSDLIERTAPRRVTT